jgi:hypothetical protein
MADIFSSIPDVINREYSEYEIKKDIAMRRYDNLSYEDYLVQCKAIENHDFILYDENIIKDNHHRTYIKDFFLHIYFVESEKTLRIVVDKVSEKYATSQEDCENIYPSVLWQYEVDHALIDCGMCYIIRCCDGSFFVIDSAHMLSSFDNIRIIKFLRQLNNGEKPLVSGWYFSHSHDDHVAKFLDILDYNRDEIDIECIYYNFPPVTHRDNECWGENTRRMTTRFEETVIKHPDIKKVILHTGQRFFVRNLEFVVLCTHEDVFPNSLEDYNNSSTALMMTANGSKVLFPGDCSDESDKILVGRYGDYLKTDIVQISHHGHQGTSCEFYRLAAAKCALFPITQIKFDEELPKQKPNRVAIELAEEYHIASNGTAQIPLPYKFGQTKIFPDETFEDFYAIYELWKYDYTTEYKQKLYEEFLKRRSLPKPECL